MSAGDPIKLGSATGTTLTFEAGSSITTSESGIQTASIRLIGGDHENLDAYMSLLKPGMEFNFGSYLPSGFKVDEVTVEYLEGKALRFIVAYKRPDPNAEDEDGKRNRTVSVDTAMRNVFDPDGAGTFQFGAFLVPEPIVTVRYNSDDAPALRTGRNYVKPSDPEAKGFPVPEPFYLYSLLSFTSETDYTTAKVKFGPDPLGWQLIAIRYEEVADKSFYDVEEVYRTRYRYLSHEQVPHA